MSGKLEKTPVFATLEPQRRIGEYFKAQSGLFHAMGASGNSLMPVYNFATAGEAEAAIRAAAAEPSVRPAATTSVAAVTPEVITKSAATTPASSSASAAPSTPVAAPPTADASPQTAWKREWESSAELRAEFGSEDTFLAYRAAVDAGRVKITRGSVTKG